MPPAQPETSPESIGLAIVGASGLIGSELYRILDNSHYRISVVGRSKEKLKARFPQAFQHLTWQDFESSDASDYTAIVNLAGARASAHRWTDAYKKTMINSRVEATGMCVAKCRDNPQIHLINASGVSAYGLYTEPFIRFTEQNQDQRKGESFMQDLADRWEATALEARDYGNPVTLLRSGVVFDTSDGALPEMMLPFKLFVGGRIGAGKQMISWISLEDEARIIAFLLERPDITGPVNCTAPGACSNADFATALGQAMGRPSFFTTPAFVLRTVMGQMAEELILNGQNVYPEKLFNAGFQFVHQTIEDYFEEALAE